MRASPSHRDRGDQRGESSLAKAAAWVTIIGFVLGLPTALVQLGAFGDIRLPCLPGRSVLPGALPFRRLRAIQHRHHNGWYRIRRSRAGRDPVSHGTYRHRGGRLRRRILGCARADPRDVRCICPATIRNNGNRKIVSEERKCPVPIDPSPGRHEDAELVHVARRWAVWNRNQAERIWLCRWRGD